MNDDGGQGLGVMVMMEKILNGFMEASSDKFSKLEDSVRRIEGYIGKIAKEVLSTEFKDSKESSNQGSDRVVLRSGRVVNNGREGETVKERSEPPREVEDREVQVNKDEQEVELPKGDPL
ncbi:hypothetical protein Q3G72_016185 [Acer saccharum]|nr:hypothetical protein Q3G72_016185 [Acer saccharum]